MNNHFTHNIFPCQNIQFYYFNQTNIIQDLANSSFDSIDTTGDSKDFTNKHLHDIFNKLKNHYENENVLNYLKSDLMNELKKNNNINNIKVKEFFLNDLLDKRKKNKIKENKIELFQNIIKKASCEFLSKLFDNSSMNNILREIIHLYTSKKINENEELKKANNNLEEESQKKTIIECPHKQRTHYAKVI